MKKIKDIKTGTQLLIGFGVIMAIIVTLSIVAWQQTEKLSQQTEAMYNHPLTVRRAIDVFDNNVLIMRIEFRNILLASNETEWNSAKTDYEISKDAALHQFAILKDRYLGNKAEIDSLRVYFLGWDLMQQQALENSSASTMDKTLLKRAETGDISQARSRLFSQILKIEDFAKNKANSFYTESVRLKKELATQLLIFIFVGLFISLLIASYLAHLFNSPLKEITRAAYKYSSGDKTARSKYTSKNQFGKLSDSFNEMAGTLENENLISSHAAQLTGVMLSEDDAQQFSHDLLSNLLEYTDSQMGAIYLLNDDKTIFEHFECIGMDANGCKPFSAINKEGEFGLALASKEISHVKDIPEDSRFSFNTVSGSFKPREIITIPIYSSNETVAIVSVFSIHSYSQNSIRLIENIFDTLTARMNGILTYKQLIEFSNKLKEQNAELDAQRAELTTMSDELKEQNAELEVQKTQLGEVSRLKTNFLSSMSHELRTPLNSVIALSGVLNRRLANKIEEEEYSYLEVIERNGKHLLNLINNILDLSRIESGKLEIDKNRFKINTLLSELIAMLKPQAEQKNIGLNFSERKDDLVIESDHDKCVHIFQNIIANAVKFTEKGSVDITVSFEKGNAVVKVSDTGIGISKADLPHIFDEFRQADGSNSRKFGGTGLGLSIAKKYCDLIGCDIHVESELGSGSIFTVRIPVKANYSEQEVVSIPDKNMRKLPHTANKSNSNGKTILLVEDTEAMIIQVRDILEAEDYTVVSAKNGFEALEHLGKNTPDAVILDLMMPGMDGFELLNKIRSKKQTAELPVLVLTAKILSKDELKEIKNNHVHQLIQKGRISQDSLLEAIALLMLKKEEADTLKQIEVVPVPVAGKPVLLAIEDNHDNMLSLKAIIGDQCKFIEAVNGIEGIEKAQKHLPHLILMDIAMPGMNGFEALKAIRKNEALKHIPVIVVTSSAMRGDKNYFLNYGFNGYVSKPVDGDVLFEEIYKWLEIEKQ